ncbi:conserved hypothetical protein [Novosphingobium sp. 9U]|nr:conserved hypothetical protein [Novosphingobium sp. 9U]
MTVSVHAQENRVSVGARVVTVYDSNQLRFGDQRVDGPKDNTSIAPGATIDINRNFARQRVYLQGAAEYVFNSRYRFLNRESLNFTGGAQLRFGPRCQINPSAALFRAQSDLEDLGVVTSNVVTIQDYSISASCSRPAGFFPVVSGSIQRTDNARRTERNQTSKEGRLGIVWRRPSLGEAELFAQVVEIRRNRLLAAQTDFVRDTTNVKTLGLRLARSVGTRIATEVQAAYTHADPAPGIRGYSGATYRGQVTYDIAPRLGISANLGRALSGRGNLGTSYYVSDSAELKIRAKLSAKTSAGAGIEAAKIQFRGEDPIFTANRRGTDYRYTVSGNVSYDLARTIGLNLASRYRHRDANNGIFDYSSFATTVTASIKF